MYITIMIGDNTHTHTHTHTHSLSLSLSLKCTRTNIHTCILQLWLMITHTLTLSLKYTHTHIHVSARAYMHTNTHTHTYIYISSSSCRAISTDISDPLSLPLSIVHRFRQVFRATPRIYTELLYVGSSWSPCLCSSMQRGPQEYITYELVPTSPAVSRMSGSSNFDSFRDGW